MKSHSKKPLTETEQRVLRIVAFSVYQRGFQPSYREIATDLGWASAGYVTQVVRSLCKKGVVSKMGSRALSFDYWNYI